MAAKKRAAKKASGKPAAKRQKKSDDPIWCTQSKRSPLVHQDLHAIYCNPDTYKLWTKVDWEEARECLPSDAPVAEDGYSVPMEYFKHNVHWRRYVREFQEDLGAGRYEPEWQRQAKQAMEERERGDFDEWKHEQFEQYWGQKSQTNPNEHAGESAKLKLEDLIQGGSIKTGDILSYCRVFGKKPGRVMVEKNAKIEAADGVSLTLHVPPSQLKHAAHSPRPKVLSDMPNQEIQSHENSYDVVGICRQQRGASTVSGADETKNGVSSGDKTETGQAGSHSEDCDSMPDDNGTKHVDSTCPAEQGSSSQTLDRVLEADNSISSASGHESIIAQTSIDTDGKNVKISRDKTKEEQHTCQQNDTNANARSSDTITGEFAHEKQDGAVTQEASKHDSVQSKVEDLVSMTVKSLADLEKRLVAIDGRVDMESYRSSNAWKAMRIIRNNQDMGSLFEIREDFYIHSSNTIVKEPKQRRQKKGR